MDGQKDAVYHYDAAGEFVSSSPLPTDVNDIACLDGGGFLFGVSIWNDSEYKDKQVVICDKDLKIIDSYVEYDGKKDSNFEYPTLGFIRGKDGTLSFNRPIEDKVYVFSPDGKPIKAICFDFGQRKVKDEYRPNIELYLDDVQASRFIINGFFPAGDLLAGCLFDGGEYTNVILDKGQGAAYSSKWDFGSICLLGGSTDCAIFWKVPTGEEDSPGETLVLFKS